MTHHVSPASLPALGRRAPRFFAAHTTKCLLGLAAAVASLGLAATGHAQVVTTFSNNTAIDIPRNTLTTGPASLYADTITVGGVGNTLQNITVTFNNFAHAYPDDVDVLLVGPGGQNVLLMSDAGGLTPVSGLTLTFSQAATASLPNSTVLSSGTFLPTNFDAPGTVDSFASPAPNVGPYGTTLSAFTGTNPNGVWSLYVLDDEQGNNGSMAGWSLTVTANPVPEPSSLALGAVALVGVAGAALRRRAQAAK